MMKGDFSFMTAREVLIHLSVIHQGDYEAIMRHVQLKTEIKSEDVAKTMKGLKSKALTMIDPDYPEVLKHLARPPIVLYYRGNVELLSESFQRMAYIGSRKASAYGLRMVKKIVPPVAEAGIVIVNGMAIGIDGAALQEALEVHGKCIAVLGSGINRCYPQSNNSIYNALVRDGLILSEYPDDTEPIPEHFPIRNRIVAGIADALIVGEAKPHSGSLITVNYALGHIREIGCVPFHADEDSACNRMIQLGAALIETPEDALMLLHHARRIGEKNL